MVRIGDRARARYGNGVNATWRPSCHRKGQRCPDGKWRFSRRIVLGTTCCRTRHRAACRTRPLGHGRGSSVFHGWLRTRIQGTACQPRYFRQTSAPSRVVPPAARLRFEADFEGRPSPRCSMKIKSFLLVVVLTLITCISERQVVKAGSPPSPPTSFGAAAITGVVKFTGAVQAARPISMSADPSCAKQHPTPFLAKEVVVDSKGGLQNVIVFVADGLGERTFDPPTEPAVIAQKGCLYQPHVLAVRANQPLEVVNNDSTAHNIHPTPANN